MGGDIDALEVVVRWGDYRRVEAEGDGLEENRREVARESETAGEQPGEDNDESGGDARRPGQGAGDEPGADDRSARSWWQRIPREEPVAVALPTVPENPRPYPAPNSGGLAIHVVARPVNAGSFAGRIATGARSLSLFLVNNRTAASHQEREVAFAFQAEIEVRSATPFVPRPDPREVSGEDRDERVADLHYAHTPEYAAGHGVSADWELVDGACRVLRTTWTPAADVEKTETIDVPGAELDMRVPGALADGFATEAALSPLATEYRSWIEDRRAGLGALSVDVWRQPGRSCSSRRSPRPGWSTASAHWRTTRTPSTPSAPRTVPSPQRSRVASLVKGDGRSDSARSRVSQFKNNPGGRPSPVPLENCPWCGADFTPDSFILLPDSDRPNDLRITCANRRCEFSASWLGREPVGARLDELISGHNAWASDRASDRHFPGGLYVLLHGVSVIGHLLLAKAVESGDESDAPASTTFKFVTQWLT